MIFTGILLAIIVGFLFINNISPKFNLGEQIGLSFPLGIFCVTLIMLALDVVNISLTRNNILIVMILLIVIMLLLLFFRKKYKEIFTKFINSFKISIGEYNLIWLVFVALIIYVEYMNFQKCMFWPSFDTDSVVGWDSIGYFVSKEFTFKDLSIYQENYNPMLRGTASYITYTPLVQLSYAFVYLFGTETSKIIPGLMYAFFLFAFYSISKRAINRTGAAIITFFVLITPEMLAWSSLSMTNIIHAIYASLGVVYLAVWFRKRERRDLYLSAILLAINVWTRREGMAFIGGAFCVLFIDVWITKKYKDYLFFALISLSTIVIWTAFTKFFGFYSEDVAIIKPFWDSAKAGTIWEYTLMLFKSTQYYGLSFIVFVAGFVCNLWFIIKKRDNIYLLIIMLLAIVLYSILLYHIEYKFDSLENVLLYSAKRFMFCFIPLLWFYVASNHSVLWVLNKIELFLSVRKK